MNVAEFNRLTRSLVELLKPRIDKMWWPAIEGPMEGGEYGYTVEELVLTVVEDQVPVSADELDKLRTLAAEHWERTTLLAKLEQVQPQDTAS